MPTEEGGPHCKDVFIMGVTRMQHGVCVGGIDVATSTWVRPVRAFGELQATDLTCPAGNRFETGDVVRFTFDAPHPRPPHGEDWIWNPAAHPAEVLRRPGEEERDRLLHGYCEPNPLAVLNGEDRSLCLARVERIEASFGIHPRSGNFEARIVAPGLTDERGFPCVDLRWRALGRVLTCETGLPERFSDEELRARLGYQRVYLALGKGRLFQEQHWPLVGGVWLVPDYTATIDYANL